tara:strand:- start:5193 stop:5375 length:183 start_codon:yes stop_codon:yes gene_type:complete
MITKEEYNNWKPKIKEYEKEQLRLSCVSKSVCRHPDGFQDWDGDRYVCYKCKEPPNKNVC